MASTLWNSSCVVPISTVYEALYDGPHATPPPANDGPIFLGIKNITEDGHLDLADVRHINEEDFAAWTRRVLPRPGDIVFTYEATLNRYAIIPHGFRGCLGRRLALIRPDTTKVDTRFLFYTFFGQTWRETISRNVLSGSTVDRIPLTKFPSFPVSLPPLPTQRKITAILAAYDDLIEKNTRRIQILEEMARMLYREWFVNFHFPGHEGNEMIETKHGLLPSGWHWAKLSDVLVDYIGGGWGNDESSNDFPSPAYVIRGTDIPGARNGQITSCPLRYHKASNLNSRKISKGDIVFEVSGGSKDQPVGRALLVNERLVKAFDNDLMCASFCKLMRIGTVASPEFVYLNLDHTYQCGTINKYQVQSTGITNFKFSVFLEDHNLPIAPQEVMRQFTEVAASLLESISALGIRNNNLRQTRDLLLPKLVSGEIDVSDLNIAMKDDSNDAKQFAP